MEDNYSLWRVTFLYETPGDRLDSRLKGTYIVVAHDKEEASKKAYDFSSLSLQDSFSLPPEGLVRTSVRRIQRRKLTLPELTLPEDREQFSIVPRLTGDHSIEYLVTEIKGK